MQDVYVSDLLSFVPRGGKKNFRARGLQCALRAVLPLTCGPLIFIHAVLQSYSDGSLILAIEGAHISETELHEGHFAALKFSPPEEHKLWIPFYTQT